MNIKKIIINLSVITLIISNIFTLIFTLNTHHQNGHRLTVQANIHTKQYKVISEENNHFKTQINALESYVKKIRKKTTFIISRSDDRFKKMNITAYTKDECDKLPTDAGYGVTSSGHYVKDWHTVAAGPSIKFGTKIYIPYFKDKPNLGIFVVQDRGGAIKNDCLDIYINDQQYVDKFGRRQLDVYFLEVK